MGETRRRGPGIRWVSPTLRDVFAMSHHGPEKTVVGRCPNCGKSRIGIVLEGSSTFFTSGPSEYYAWWVGRCCRCDSYLEAYLKDGDNLTGSGWDFVEEEKVEFILGSPLPTRAPPGSHPLWDSERDG